MAQPSSPESADLEALGRLTRIAGGYRAALALYATARLGIADALADGPQPPSVVAERTHTHAPSLARLLRMLHAIGVLDERDGRYALTAAGTYLRRDVPGSMRDAVLFTCDVELSAYRHLAEGIREGVTPFELAFGRPVFDHLALPENAELARRFNGFMSGLSASQARAIVAAYDFRPHRVLVDVGGGDGTLIAAVLRAHPQLRGVLFDLPHVAETARAKLEAAGVADRCRVIAGSFFEEVPEGGDLVLLKFILHDWDDEQCLRILGNCRRAMRSDACLVIVDRVIPERETDPDGFAEAVGADIHMLVGPGGRERTRAELEALLARAGFALERILPMNIRPRIAEARPVS